VHYKSYVTKAFPLEVFESYLTKWGVIIKRLKLRKCRHNVANVSFVLFVWKPQNFRAYAI
jgi:hypothetical protein